MEGSLDDVFAQLRPLLARHAQSLVVARDEPGDLQVEARRTGPSGTRMSFGAVQIRDSDVSFQLMAVYSHPTLLEGLSDDLRGLMQSKGSFGFTPQTLTPELVAELSALVDAGLARFRADKLT